MQFSVMTAFATAFITYLLAGIISMFVALLIKIMSAALTESKRFRHFGRIKRLLAWAYFRKSLDYFKG